MEKNQRNQKNQEQRSSEQDQLRQSTPQEPTTNVGQNRDMEQNESLRDAEQGSGRSYDYGTEGSDMDRGGTGRRNDHSGHQNLSSNTGGTVDMGPNSITGSNRESRAGTGSGLNTKRSVTGSDFDGQNKDL